MGLLDNAYPSGGGLLGSGWDDPKSMAALSLAAGLLSGRTLGEGLGGGLLGYQRSMAGAREQQMREALFSAQIEQRQADAAKDRAALAAAQRRAAALANPYGDAPPSAGPMSGGALGSGTFGIGDAVPGAGPAGGRQESAAAGGGRQIDVQRLLAEGVDPDTIGKLGQLQNLGRSKVARTIEGRDAQGRPVTMQVDDYGQPVGAPIEQWKAPVFQDFGGAVGAIDPVTLRRQASFPKTMTPGESASNAVAWANNGLARQRLALEQDGVRRGETQYDADRGLLIDKRTGQAIPVTQGGAPVGAKDKGLTEVQAKATQFSSRMADASRVIGALEGKVMPFNVDRAGYRAEFPSWVPGGQAAGSLLTTANNWSVPEEAQQYRQAQENWVTANLRLESGAAIGKDELAKDIRKWFPQPGDGDAVIKQKAAARKVAERAMLAQTGPGAAKVDSIVNGDPAGGAGGNWAALAAEELKRRGIQ